MCWMMLLTVGWKSSFMASQDILSMPWEDHFTKFTLWETKGQGLGVRVCLPRCLGSDCSLLAPQSPSFEGFNLCLFLA